MRSITTHHSTIIIECYRFQKGEKAEKFFIFLNPIIIIKTKAPINLGKTQCIVGQQKCSFRHCPYIYIYIFLYSRSPFHDLFDP